MAEGRMLKRNISESRRLSELKTDSARMLWTWIIPFLDSEGRFYASADMIKGKVVPRISTFTTKNIPAYISDMARVGLITLYDVDGEKLLQFRKFAAFQNIKKEREAPPLPAPSDQDLIRSESRVDQDLIGSKSRPPFPNLREVNLREEKEGAGHDLRPQKLKYLDSVFLTLEEYKKLQGALGQKSLEAGIEKLDYSITVKSGKYKDHYKTLLNWHKRGYLSPPTTNQQPKPGNGNGNDTIRPAAYIDPFTTCPRCHKEIQRAHLDGKGCIYCAQPTGDIAKIVKGLAKSMTMPTPSPAAPPATSEEDKPDDDIDFSEFAPGARA